MFSPFYLNVLDINTQGLFNLMIAQKLNPEITNQLNNPPHTLNVRTKVKCSPSNSLTVLTEEFLSGQDGGPKHEDNEFEHCLLAKHKVKRMGGKWFRS